MSLKEIREKASKYLLEGRSKINKNNIDEWIKKINDHENINNLSNSLQNLNINYPINIDLGTKIYWRIDSHPITMLSDKKDSSFTDEMMQKIIIPKSNIERNLIFPLSNTKEVYEKLLLPNDDILFHQIILAIYGVYQQLRYRDYMIEIDENFDGLYGNIISYLGNKLQFEGITQTSPSEYYLILSEI